MVATNFLRFSGESGMPMNCSSRPVAPITGQIASLTRTLSAPSSTASDLLIRLTAPLLLLYQVRPGRGRMPAGGADVEDDAAFLLAQDRHHRVDHVEDRLRR